MAKFLSIPKEIEAFQWFNPGHERHRPIAGVFCIAEAAVNPKMQATKKYFVITLQNQKVFVKDGEWIVTESNGANHYPIAEIEFSKNYMPLEASAQAK